MCKQLYRVRFIAVPTMGLLVALLALTLLVGGCGSEPTPVVAVTVVTATSTIEQPTPVVVTATPSPEPDTPTPIPSDTPDLVATQIAIERAAHATMTAEAPTATPTEEPPTATLAPTKTRAPVVKPPPSPTNTPVPVVYSPPSLLSPAPNANCWLDRGCTFTWTWGGNLKANEYFQVQLIGPNNEHRGIHPPTKGYSFTSDDSVYMIVPDWCNVNYFCHIKWTVAIIKWDGVDPSKIGVTIVEAEPRDVIL